MPIAFDPPASAGHGATLQRQRSSHDDDPAAPDAFTSMLAAAATVAGERAKTGAASGEPADPKDKDGAGLQPDTSIAALPGLHAAVTRDAAASSGDVATAARGATAASTRVSTVPGDTATATGQRTAQHTAAHVTVPKPGATAAPTLASVVASTPANDRRSPEAPIPDAASAAAERVRQDSAAAHARGMQSGHPMGGAVAIVRARPDATGAAAPHGGAPGPADGRADGPTTSTPKPGDAKALTEVALPAPAAGPHSARAENITAIAPTHVASVNTPAFTPGWQDEMLGKLAHVVLSRHERAELKLNPGELGPVAVRIEMHADQATVTIVAASPDTRSALEQSLPQLRDLLAAQGITLGQASVHDGSAQRDATPQGAQASRDAAQEPTGGGELMHAVQLIARRPDRLVDVFA